MSPPDSNKPYFFCSSLIDLEISLRLFFENFLLLPDAEMNIYFGLTPLHNKSDIEDLITFLIINSGYLK